jgi:hypothetical protein
MDCSVIIGKYCESYEWDIVKQQHWNGMGVYINICETRTFIKSISDFSNMPLLCSQESFKETHIPCIIIWTFTGKFMACDLFEWFSQHLYLRNIIIMILITANKIIINNFNKIMLFKVELRSMFISHNTWPQIEYSTCLHLNLAHIVLTFIWHSDCAAQVTYSYIAVFDRYERIFMYSRFYFGVMRSISVLSRGRGRSCRACPVSCARRSPTLPTILTQ